MLEDSLENRKKRPNEREENVRILPGSDAAIGWYCTAVGVGGVGVGVGWWRGGGAVGGGEEFMGGSEGLEALAAGDGGGLLHLPLLLLLPLWVCSLQTLFFFLATLITESTQSS